MNQFNNHDAHTQHSAGAAAIYISYNSILEPLVESQVLAYLRELHRIGGYQFRLLTFEPAPIPRQLQNELTARLIRWGIQWSHLAYHKRPSLLVTLLDVLAGSAWLIRQVARKRPELIHARSHVPALMALLARPLTRVPLLFDCRGMFADAYVDFGHWSKRSLKYRLTKLAEPILFARSNHTVVLTHRFERILVPAVPRERLTVIPCCVDMEQYRPRQVKESDGSFTLCFAGSVANWYLLPEMLDFAVVAAQIIPNFRLLLLNRNEHRLLKQELDRRGLSEMSEVKAASPSEMPGYLRKASAGIAFLKPTFAMQAASPTKIGEYLAAGLPVVHNLGVGDLDHLLAGVGVSVARFDSTAYEKAAHELRSLTCHAEAIIRACRNRADECLSLSGGVQAYGEIYNQLIQAR